MSDNVINRLSEIAQDYRVDFTVNGRASETNQGLFNRDAALEKYGPGVDALEYNVPDWRNTEPKGENEFDYFVRGGDLPRSVQNELKSLFGDDLKFDNWDTLKGNPYKDQDPGGIVFTQDGGVDRNYLMPWQ